jgi:CheY-like chemotaxis protein
VDPDADDRYYTCMLLHRFGYAVVSALTTEKAIEFMIVAPPSAIVADAKGDGSSLPSRLAQDPRFFDIPLIMLSWWPDRALTVRAKTGEIAAFLRKPLDAAEFYHVIQSSAEKSRRRNIRIASNLIVRIDDDPGACPAFVTVISEYGMFVRTLHPRPVDTRMAVVLELQGKLLNLEATVLYVIGFEEGPFKEPGMGMKFVKIGREDRDLIAAFIREQLEAGIARRGTPK